MSWFMNMKVKAKMVLAFSTVIALTAALAVFAVLQLNSVAGSFRYAIDHPMEAETQLRILDHAIGELRRLTTTMSLFASNNDPARIDGYYADLLEKYKLGTEAINEFEQVCRTDTTSPKEAMDGMLKMLADLRGVFTKYKEEVSDPVAREARAGNPDGALQYIGAGVGYANALEEQVDVLIDLVEDAAHGTIHDAEASADRTLWILVGATVFVAVLSIIIALSLAGLISKPLVELSGFMKKAGSTGDITMTPKDVEQVTKFSRTQDEIGETIASSAAFIQHVVNIATELESIAGGDLTADVELLSDADNMGKSLKHMVDSLNNMFGDINASTTQVSSGAKQIADGAQALAQGSTQQAASVEQLSASISEINRMAKENSETATDALSDSQKSEQLMRVCMEQMSQMTAAMKTIDDKSRSITRTTKVIDDIAFQTNILALNAAVEAARAGQHGKGFAVVAEEVRNLASKSADAAKETASLIESSSQSVGEGNQIVEKVNESLHSVAELAQRNAQKTEIIQTVSAQQSAAMAQVNTGIDQVAQVVQQNSATAEQSAAASEEMSGQSAMLEDLIAQFKLKEAGQMKISRSAPGATLPAAARRRIAMPEKTTYVPSDGGDFGKY